MIPVTRGSEFLCADYTVPPGASGLRVGSDISWFRYKLVQGQFQALDSRGDSSSLGVRARRAATAGRRDDLRPANHADLL
ncbi:hypothetical protein ACFJGW_18675 [Burkholderiaceae bacterium UC74_6]